MTVGSAGGVMQFTDKLQTLRQDVLSAQARENATPSETDGFTGNEQKLAVLGQQARMSAREIGDVRRDFQS
jgi:hypothetical protein